MEKAIITSLPVMQLKDTEDIPKTAYRGSFRMNQANIQKNIFGS